MAGVLGFFFSAHGGFGKVFHDGGFMMWPLLVAAILGLAVIFWRLAVLSRARMVSKRVIKRVRAYLSDGQIDGAVEYCERSAGPAAAILLAGLKRVGKGREAVEKAIETAGALELAFLEKGLIVLSSVSTVAPLMGFLGTVIGMIQAFAAIEMHGEVEATLVAAGIKVALITTASGLAIAIPVSIGHNFFVTRIDDLILDMEESAAYLVESVEGKGRERMEGPGEAVF
jgi:biopolymer transport protein ExbB